MTINARTNCTQLNAAPYLDIRGPLLILPFCRFLLVDLSTPFMASGAGGNGSVIFVKHQIILEAYVY